MRTPFLTLIAAVVLIASAAADRRAAAQEPATSAVQASSSSAPAGEIRHTPEVTITGQREFATKITGFVNQLTDFDYGDSNRGLARWQDPVCPLVTGLPRGMAEYILGRLTEIAQAAGVPIAKESCRHENLFIIVTKQPEAYLREQEQRHGADIFGGAEPMLINEFIATPRPVRTWYDTIERTPEGLPMYRMAFPGNATRAVSGAGGTTVIEGVQSNSGEANTVLANPWSQASHLVLNVVWAIRRVYVVVDPTQFKGVKLGQLADYVSMAGLAQIKLDPHLNGDSTILTLFDTGPQAASAGLTDWDRAFLKSIYAAEQKSVLARSAIAQEMVREIAP